MVPALPDSQARLLGRLKRTQRPMRIAGIVLVLAGAAYMTWGVMRFDPGIDPRLNPGFDWPVARLAFLFEHGHAIVDNAVPETNREVRLLQGLTSNRNFSSGVMVLLLRILFGTLALVMGLAIMTVVVERARLLAMIRHLRE